VSLTGLAGASGGWVCEREIQGMAVTTMHARVRDVMTTGVVAVGPGASFGHLASLLRAHRVSGLPVVDDDGIVLGVVSEADLLEVEAARDRHGPLARRKPASPGELTARDLMTRPAVTTSPAELVSDAGRLMSSRKLRRLPVVDGQGRLVGIVSRSDVLSVFRRADEDIRREITEDVIADGFFTDPGRFTVTVKDSIVTLAGAPGSVVLGVNIVYRVRHVEGVIAVRDCFTYPRAT
jgi:CBS domain-containing protein